MSNQSHLIIRADRDTLLSLDIDGLVSAGWKLKHIYGLVKDQKEQHFAVMVKETFPARPIITDGREFPHGVTP